MLLEFTGLCKHCAEDVKMLVLNGEAIGNCKSCGEKPFDFRKTRGLISVVANPNQIGVKIGLTIKPIEQRLKSLNNTGVAGRFSWIAVFPSGRLKQDEAKVHEKLGHCHISKENFNIAPVDAVVKAYRALRKREPIFRDESDKERFKALIDLARIRAKLRFGR